MSDLFAPCKDQFASEVSQLHLGDPQPVRADPWIISSLLQKSIRRGESAIAQRAALTLLSLRGSAIWRRLMIIAFEDIGAGSPDALAITVAVGSDPVFRSDIGGNSLAAAGVAHVLCKSAKDRSADYLGCGPRFHPTLFAAPPASALSSLKRQLCIVADRNTPLFLRTLAAWHACGIGRGRDGKGDLSALLRTYRKLGTPLEGRSPRNSTRFSSVFLFFGDPYCAVWVTVYVATTFIGLAVQVPLHARLHRSRHPG